MADVIVPSFKAFRADRKLIASLTDQPQLIRYLENLGIDASGTTPDLFATLLSLIIDAAEQANSAQSTANQDRQSIEDLRTAIQMFEMPANNANEVRQKLAELESLILDVPLFTAAEKNKLAGIVSGAGVVSVAGSLPITSTGGATPTIAINAATGAAAGSMSAADKTKLDTMTANAAVASVSGTAPIVSSGGTTPAISINPATPSGAGSLAASDKTKLDSLINGLNASLTASVTTTNTIVDANILQLVVPAGTFQVGSVAKAQLYAVVSDAAGAGTLSVWISVGGTKLFTMVIPLPATAITSQGMRVDITMTQRSATTMQFAGAAAISLASFQANEVIGSVLNGFTAASANTITLGWNWSVANAANSAIANTAVIAQAK